MGTVFFCHPINNTQKCVFYFSCELVTKGCYSSTFYSRFFCIRFFVKFFCFCSLFVILMRMKNFCQVYQSLSYNSIYDIHICRNYFNLYGIIINLLRLSKVTKGMKKIYLVKQNLKNNI